MSETLSDGMIQLDLDESMQLGDISTLANTLYKKSIISSEGIKVDFIKMLKSRIDELYNQVVKS